MKVGGILLILIIIAVASFFSVKLVGFAVEGSVSSDVVIDTSVDTPAPSVGGGGGGAGPSGPSYGFNIDNDLLKVTIKQGETVRKVIKVTNIGNNVITIDKIQPEGVEHLMAISQKSFTLSPGQTKEILIDIFAKEDEVPDAYIGRILISGAGIEKVVNVIIEVKARAPLFDVTTQLAKTRYLPGENIVAEITVINMGDLEEIDIELYYAIKDFEDNILASRIESLAIGNELTITRQLNIPNEVEFGTYVFYVRANYEDVFAAASETFEVEETVFAPIFEEGNLIYVIIIVVLILIIIIFIVFWRSRKKEKEAEAAIRKRQGEGPKIVYVGGR